MYEVPCCGLYVRCTTEDEVWNLIELQTRPRASGGVAVASKTPPTEAAPAPTPAKDDEDNAAQRIRTVDHPLKGAKRVKFDRLDAALRRGEALSANQRAWMALAYIIVLGQKKALQAGSLGGMLNVRGRKKGKGLPMIMRPIRAAADVRKVDIERVIVKVKTNKYVGYRPGSIAVSALSWLTNGGNAKA